MMQPAYDEQGSSVSRQAILAVLQELPEEQRGMQVGHSVPYFVSVLHEGHVMCKIIQQPVPNG